MHRPSSGMPSLGEMFDLDALAEACASRGQWDFYRCSVPRSRAPSSADRSGGDT